MEPREEQKHEPKAPEPCTEQLKRFRLVKLEERIAPLSGGGTSGGERDRSRIPLICPFG